MKKNANEKLKIWLNADLNTKDSSNESEVECPYCYAIYRIDKYGNPYISNY